MTAKLEIAVLKADVYPVNNREIYWLISKGQLEHVVTDISVNYLPFAQKHLDGIATWQGLVVPVVNLEKYFNFRIIRGAPVTKRVLLRTAVLTAEGIAARLLINVPYDIKMRVIESGCVPADISRKELESRGLLGVYEWEADKLLLVPDFAQIAAGDI